ncbi:MAG: trypsin-like peptidase domain-containing protein, partial [Gemmataceae bacterium]
TWFVAKSRFQVAPEKQEAAKSSEDKTVKLTVAVARTLVKSLFQHRPDGLISLLEKANLKTSTGQPIEISCNITSSQKMVEDTLRGVDKPHILIPVSKTYLDFVNKENSLLTGKPLITQTSSFIRQPHVIALNRIMAEAMGWPNKKIEINDLRNILKEGWQSIGKPEWGPLKHLGVNPIFSDMGYWGLLALSSPESNGKFIPSDVLENPVFKQNCLNLHKATVWYMNSYDEFINNEASAYTITFHSTYVPEQHLISINDHSARRQLKPKWVAIYLPQGDIVNEVAAGLIDRDWVSAEQKDAAQQVFNYLRSPEIQNRLMGGGYRPIDPSTPLKEPFDLAHGIDPSQPKKIMEIPSIEVLLDCKNACEKLVAEYEKNTGFSLNSSASSSASKSPDGEERKLSQMTPVVHCVHRAKPSTVIITRSSPKKIIGTGVIVDERGYIITNRHVVGEEAEVEVRFLDSKDNHVHKGEVVWRDANQDLALVRISIGGKLPVIEFADSNNLNEGETVVVIGNPYGYVGTVSMGIISALNRRISVSSEASLSGLIQTDASVNPGNSGGPLLNIAGQLIGINVAIREGAQNIAFAIPSNLVRENLKKLFAKQ